MDINRVILVGRLTRDPSLKHTQGGDPVCELSMALNYRKQVDGEWQDEVDYFDVTVFGGQAEPCKEYLAKGKRVAVEGRLRQDRWKDKDTDKARSKVYVIATNVQFVERQDGQHTDAGADFAPAAASATDADDDIPF